MEREVRSREVSQLNKFCDSTLLESVCSCSEGTESERSKGSSEWQHSEGVDGLGSFTRHKNVKTGDLREYQEDDAMCNMV